MEINQQINYGITKYLTVHSKTPFILLPDNLKVLIMTLEDRS